MQKEILTQIAEQYRLARQTVLDPNNYERAIDVQQVELYFYVLEQVLERPCNRLVHLEGFLRDADGLMVHKMFPFGYFKKIALEQLRQYCVQLIKLTECYALLYPDEAESLTEEPHEQNT